MAFETPTSILIRRLALEDKKFYEKFFGQTEKVPTLAQFNPMFTSFEAPEGEILLTGMNAMPLIRYAVGDKGGVKTLADLPESGLSLKELKQEAVKHDAPIYQLPFVYVYERADFSIKLYGATLFPEHVREALQDALLLKKISGKFSMQTLTNKQHDQYLEVNIELRPDADGTPELSEHVSKKIVTNLLKKNSEYANNYSLMKERVLPKIVFWSHEDPLYFKPGIKQKWVKK